jgi:predicted O-methyltransferase YrrM
MKSLDSDNVGKVLDRLFKASEANDPNLMARLSQEGHQGIPSDSGARAERYGEVYMPVSREVGRFLYMLARSQGSRTVVEFGMSFGISTVHLAAAMRDNGRGRVISTELHAPKVEQARKNLDEAGLSQYVEIRQGDALQTLRNLDCEIDLVLLDGWKELYLPVLTLLEPRLRSGAIIVADDTDLFPDKTRPYQVYVREPQNGYTSVSIAMGDGLEVSVRTA